MSAVIESKKSSQAVDGFWETMEAKEYLKTLQEEFQESQPQPLPELDSGFGFL